MKCSHCVVPAAVICTNEFNTAPESPVGNPYRLKIFPFDSPPELATNAWCEFGQPALGDYTGCWRTGGPTLCRSQYTPGTYPDFVDIIAYFP